MNNAVRDSQNACSKAGLVMLGVACLLFLVGLIKDPTPSDTIRGMLVYVLGVAGIVFYVVGRLVAAKRTKSGRRA
jgi:multisubunit Na+/H+ antiporter MnhB subunit